MYGFAVKGVKIIFGPEKGPKIGFVLHKKLVIGQPVYSTFADMITFLDRITGLTRFIATEKEIAIKATEATESTENLIYKISRFIGFYLSSVISLLSSGLLGCLSLHFIKHSWYYTIF